MSETPTGQQQRSTRMYLNAKSSQRLKFEPFTVLGVEFRCGDFDPSLCRRRVFQKNVNNYCTLFSAKLLIHQKNQLRHSFSKILQVSSQRSHNVRQRQIAIKNLVKLLAARNTANVHYAFKATLANFSLHLYKLYFPSDKTEGYALKKMSSLPSAYSGKSSTVATPTLAPSRNTRSAARLPNPPISLPSGSTQDEKWFVFTESLSKSMLSLKKFVLADAVATVRQYNSFNLRRGKPISKALRMVNKIALRQGFGVLKVNKVAALSKSIAQLKPTASKIREDQMFIQQRYKNFLATLDQRKKENVTLVKTCEQQLVQATQQVAQTQQEIQSVQTQISDKQTYIDTMNKTAPEKPFFQGEGAYITMRNLYKTLSNMPGEGIKKSSIVKQTRAAIDRVDETVHVLLIKNAQLKQTLTVYQEAMGFKNFTNLTTPPDCYLNVKDENEQLRKCIKEYVKDSYGWQYMDNLTVIYDKLAKLYEQASQQLAS